ncbi:molecular chaperone [Shewanella sp. NIFS-20-20]|uniref:molecular chaperone n=1 Tax=Shewanella sp. NIFS-20-20 TaxID=2853806 RepID=UPI001C486518|nr:molecular chaperone [Shewanella sp. NIFS-20-20]MBV7314340.1 molecular chaperone [Shewanella sp. NIFS-20-20]
MKVGFDYGSANCAVGVMIADEVSLIELMAGSPYLSSTLYAWDKDLIALAVYQGLPSCEQRDYAGARSAELSRARRVLIDLDLRAEDTLIFFGQDAIDQYLECPEEGFYVRSPKSFLGASGLRADQIALFEDIVTLMMRNILQRIYTQTGTDSATDIKAVIGRPVNFQGRGGDESNQQAQAILTTAALRAGFCDVAFLFEPLAAGMDFEAKLTAERTVLVVDIGGGTTDCSVVKMGPERRQIIDREHDFLAHTGQRVGGNDVDIALAMHSFTPLLGRGSFLASGKPLPNNVFWNAVAVNDVSAQRDFMSLSCRKMIEDLKKEALEPSSLELLLKVQKYQLGYQLVRSAEQVKIGLSERDCQPVGLDYLAADVTKDVTRDDFCAATLDTLDKIQQLMMEAIVKANCQPEVIYVTGGTARSPMIFERISHCFPHSDIVVGDHFGSVTAGLTRYAQQAF